MPKYKKLKYKKLKYKKMNLFDAPEGSVLVHACNAQGVWGSGIAAEFKKRFLSAFRSYHNFCAGGPPESSVGYGNFIKDGTHFVGYLITSKSFAENKDTNEEILIQTVLSLNEFVKNLNLNRCPKIYSNKFNSGLFNVPWEETEKILQYFVKRYNLDWTVCDPNL